MNVVLLVPPGTRKRFCRSGVSREPRNATRVAKVFLIKSLLQAGKPVPSQPKVASVTRSELVRGQARSYKGGFPMPSKSKSLSKSTLNLPYPERASKLSFHFATATTMWTWIPSTSPSVRTACPGAAWFAGKPAPTGCSQHLLCRAMSGQNQNATIFHSPSKT